MATYHFVQPSHCLKWQTVMAMCQQPLQKPQLYVSAGSGDRKNGQGGSKLGWKLGQGGVQIKTKKGAVLVPVSYPISWPDLPSQVHLDVCQLVAV